MPDRHVPPPGHAPARPEHVDEPVFVDTATIIVCALTLLLLLGGCVCLFVAGRGS